ncbi:proprotein convertase P-domain-containing protein [Bacillus sp. NPDC077411]|uniref:proprotein convertase P-domain-containing protein n=1 Tax=Bacillus sp. NPDC077411 TaxID=3363947 RepID=UPI0037C5E903
MTGLTGTISKVTVTLSNMSHTFPTDIDILLVGPGGQNVLLMSDAGADLDINNVTLTFDDDASEFLPENAQIVSGTFKPTNYGSGDTFTAPAPNPPYGSLLNVFNGTNPNGTWNLFVTDPFSPDSGIIADGWSLTITTTCP